MKTGYKQSTNKVTDSVSSSAEPKNHSSVVHLAVGSRRKPHQRVLQHHRTAQVGRDLERSLRPAFCGKGTLGEITSTLSNHVLKTSGDGRSTTPPGRLFQWVIASTIKTTQLLQRDETYPRATCTRGALSRVTSHSSRSPQHAAAARLGFPPSKLPAPPRPSHRRGPAAASRPSRSSRLRQRRQGPLPLASASRRLNRPRRPPAAPGSRPPLWWDLPAPGLGLSTGGPRVRGPRNASGAPGGLARASQSTAAAAADPFYHIKFPLSIWKRFLEEKESCLVTLGYLQWPGGGWSFSVSPWAGEELFTDAVCGAVDCYLVGENLELQEIHKM